MSRNTCACAALLSISCLAPLIGFSRSQFVDVGGGVKLEVLDWGGTGRNVILLAGSGNTAHIFADFAPRLLDFCHVYAITRRGFGLSSKPERGYSTPELAEDIWRVIESLKIVKPVLIGHSMAGSEMSFVGQKRSDLLSGIVYLDANGDPMDWPWGNEEYRKLVTKSMKNGPPPAKPTEADRASVAAYREFQKRSGIFPFPPDEIQAMYELLPDGSIGKNRTPGHVSRAIDSGSISKDYRGINVPVLAIFPVPLAPAAKWKDRVAIDEEELRESDRIDEIFLQFVRRWQGNLLRAVPEARIVDLPGAHHYVFQNEESDVVRELRKFIQRIAQYTE